LFKKAIFTTKPWTGKWQGGRAPGEGKFPKTFLKESGKAGGGLWVRKSKKNHAPKNGLKP